MEIDHALTDGVSLALTLRDLALAYEGKLTPGPAAAFGQYASWLQQQHHSQEGGESQIDIEYWRDFIHTATSGDPCLIPSSSSSSPAAQTEHKQLTIPLTRADNTLAGLPALCAKHGVTMATVFQAAWGLVLHQLTSSASQPTTPKATLFGYMTANRDFDDDSSLQGAEEMLGPVINLLLCRTANINLSSPTTSITNKQNPITTLLHHQRDDFLASLDHQYGLAKLLAQEQQKKNQQQQHKQLFNSVMTLQYLDSRVAGNNTNTKTREDSKNKNSISFNLFSGRDPNAWDVTIGVQISNKTSQGSGGGGGQGTETETSVAAQRGYWSHVLSEEAAGVVGGMFANVVWRVVDVLRAG
jgi:hypothetical protein